MAATCIKIRLQSTESHYFKTTTKPRSYAGKMECNKYDPVLRKVVKFVEKKVKGN